MDIETNHALPGVHTEPVRIQNGYVIKQDPDTGIQHANILETNKVEYEFPDPPPEVMFREGESTTLNAGNGVVIRDIDLDDETVHISMGDPDSVIQEAEVAQTSMMSPDIVTEEVDVDSDTVDISLGPSEPFIQRIDLASDDANTTVDPPQPVNQGIGLEADGTAVNKDAPESGIQAAAFGWEDVNISEDPQPVIQTIDLDSDTINVNLDAPEPAPQIAYMGLDDSNISVDPPDPVIQTTDQDLGAINISMDNPEHLIQVVDIDSDNSTIIIGTPEPVVQEVELDSNENNVSMNATEHAYQITDLDSDTVDISSGSAEMIVQEVAIDGDPVIVDSPAVTTEALPATEYVESIVVNGTGPVVHYHSNQPERKDSSGSEHSKPSRSDSPLSEKDAIIVVHGKPQDPEDPIVVESVPYTSAAGRKSVAGYVHIGAPQPMLGYAEEGGLEPMSDQYVEQPGSSQNVVLYSQPGPLPNGNDKTKQLDTTEKEFWFKAKSPTNMNGFFAFACISCILNIPFGACALYLVQKGRDAPTAARGKRFGCYSILAGFLGICVTVAIIVLCVLYV